MTVLSENKLFLLEQFTLDRIKTFAERLGDPVTDRRLAVSGIAKTLARKRSLGLDAILEALCEEELRHACVELALPTDGTAPALRGRLGGVLASQGAHAIRKAANAAAAATMTALPARLVRVIDGDTIVVEAENEQQYVRFRGVDAPETSESDKAERDLDYAEMTTGEMAGLGEAAKAWLERRLAGRALFLHVQPTPAGPKKYLHHAQHRLLAYVSLDTPSGEEICEAMVREGYALVWPRNVVTRRYLHPRSLAYVEVCHGALGGQPGLWREGLAALCPRSKSEGDWGIEHCKDSCFRHDWREASA
jgi:endonuclease YncB( thermonuclease family)